MGTRAVVVLLLAACGSSGTSKSPDAPAVVTPAPARKQLEIAGGGGTVKVGSVTIAVEIGRAVPARSATASPATISGVPAVTP